MFHRLGGLESRKRAAELADARQLPRAEELLLLTRSRRVDIDGRKDTTVREPAIEDELHVSRSFELLEDHLVHLASRVDECRGEYGQAASSFDFACGAEKL